MLIKVILILLIIAMLISLSGGLNSLFQSPDKTVKWLTIRVALAVAIIVVVAVGLITGELNISAPWLAAGR